MSNWSPKPLRPLNTSGIFEHVEGDVYKSQQNNPWALQRAKDGTPHTRIGHTALRPPVASPKLYLDDMNKSDSAEKATTGDDAPWNVHKAQELADDAVKSFFFVNSEAGRDWAQKAVGEFVSKGLSPKEAVTAALDMAKSRNYRTEESLAARTLKAVEHLNKGESKRIASVSNKPAQAPPSAPAKPSMNARMVEGFKQGAETAQKVLNPMRAVKDALNSSSGKKTSPTSSASTTPKAAEPESKVIVVRPKQQETPKIEAKKPTAVVVRPQKGATEAKPMKNVAPSVKKAPKPPKPAKPAKKPTAVVVRPQKGATEAKPMKNVAPSVKKAPKPPKPAKKAPTPTTPPKVVIAGKKKTETEPVTA
jgi:hypothetical protein